METDRCTMGLEGEKNMGHRTVYVVDIAKIDWPPADADEVVLSNLEY